MLQDDQQVGEENEVTGLLTTAADAEKKQRKARVAARWLDGLDWETSVLERRHYGDIPLLETDPAIVLTGLDEPDARIKIAGAGFDYMVDAGIGHGPVDFEGVQVRILKKGVDARLFWTAKAKPKDIERLMQEHAYQVHAKKDTCGTFTLAEASVAVPFVGAAAGAIAIAQLLRLGSGLHTNQIMQIDLGAPDMVTFGAMNEAPSTSAGSLTVTVG